MSVPPPFFARRRKRLLKAMGPNSVAIIPTAPIAIRNRDVEYPFRPSSDFYYLTGFSEPQAVAVLVAGKRGEKSKFVVFCRDRDPTMETWEGRRLGPRRARTRLAADEAHSYAKLDERLPTLMENRQRIYYAMGQNAVFDEKVQAWRNRVMQKSRSGVRAPMELVAVEQLLHEMRLIKDREEIATMRRAAKISAAAHCRAMKKCRPCLMEYEIEAELTHEFMKQGSRAPAYASIVGGGANACILHYTENDAVLRDGQLLLIDAGAEIDNYASDITRTFPINGRFSPEQAAVYDIVLKAQLAAIDKVRPGNHWNEPHEAAVRVLTRGLLRLGLLKGSMPTLIKKGAYRRFYMHRTGHWLGMDVHDVGDYRVDDAWRVFEPGMILTVEPGLYIPSASKGIAKKWHNIAVRIEDDVLVTKTGCDVLTKDVPKTITEIEALMAG